MADDVTLRQINVDYDSETNTFPYTVTLFGTLDADDSPVTATDVNDGLTFATVSAFVAEMITDATWNVTN